MFRRLARFPFASAGLLIVMGLGVCGCANSPVSTNWYTPPWVRSEWEQEEKYANSSFSRKKEMTEAVAAVQGSTVEAQQQVATKLSEVILRDPILLLRRHAIKLITSLDCPKTKETLVIAANDPSSDIRIETVKALGKIPGEESIFQLQEILANDTDDDVRIAATRVLGNLPGQNSVRALGVALDDRNPALQVTATESLMQITGQESLGRDVMAWQNYVQQVTPTLDANDTKPLVPSPTTIPGQAPETLTADQFSGGTFRR